MGLLKKLQRKEQEVLHTYQLPAELGADWDDLTSQIALSDAATDNKEIAFLIGFVTSENEIEKLLQLVKSRMNDGCLFWIAYPKKSSKKYTSKINRDSGWQALGELAYEPVRQIAIDQDWSALRFRKVDQIKKLTRNSKMILSKEGHEKNPIRINSPF